MQHYSFTSSLTTLILLTSYILGAYTPTMYIRWLLQARRAIDTARKLELNGHGIQMLSWWGKTKHWSEWQTIWAKEKSALQRRYKLPKN